MKENLFDFNYEIVGDCRNFYLNGYKGDKTKGEDDISPLLKASHYDEMLVNNRITVLNKGECGNGGTSGIVEYIRNSNTGCLILVPNVSISVGKDEKYKDDNDICCVYGGVDEINYSAKIVIATYDQFLRLMSNLQDIGLSGDCFSNNFWAGRAIFIDEYHKLVDECSFRDIMSSLTNLIIKTDRPVTLMSATPHYDYIQALRDAVGNRKNIITINVSYETNKMTKSMNIYNIKQSELERLFKFFIDKKQKICIFYNNVQKITKALNAIGTDECEILCSGDKQEECGNYYSSQYNPDKRVHFMTSAYFTGHDIDEEIHHCVIIGSKATPAMALNIRDIKQILGRFRYYCGDVMNNISLFYIKEKKNDVSYDNIRMGYNNTKELLEGMGDSWCKNKTCIKHKLKNLYYSDVINQFESWSSEEKLIKELKANGYKVWTKEEDGKQVNKAKPIGELPDYEVEPNLTYKEAYKRVCKGINVSWREYRDINKIKAYVKKYGVSKKIPTKTQVVNLVNIDKIVKKSKVTLDRMNADERYISLGFADCGLYKASYLLDVLKYIQLEYPELITGKIDYGMLPIYLKDVLSAVCFRYKAGKKTSSDLWCVGGSNINFIKNNIILQNKNVAYPLFLGSCYINRELPQNGGETTKNTLKINYRTKIKDSNCYAKTTDWRAIPSLMKPLTSNEVYEWVNANKAVRLLKLKTNMDELKTWDDKIKSGKKLDKQKLFIYNILKNKNDSELKIWYKAMEDRAKKWKNVKNFVQLQISELYCDTDKEYRQSKDNMNLIDCLIIDIDENISYSEFKEFYKQYTWLAYPTISNTAPDDWVKFRVIVPLQQTLKLEGDNKLKVLAGLRSMFSPYEDKCHKMGSYVNIHDWEKKRINNGEIFNITQDDVDMLQYMLKIANDYSNKKFDSKEVYIEGDNINDILINSTIKLFNSTDKNWNTTIYNRLWYLVKQKGFTRTEIDRIKQSVTNNEFRDYIETVIKSHKEWNL